MGMSVPGTGTLGCVVWPGAVIVSSQGIPLDFYPPHVHMGLSIAPPLLPLSTTGHLHASGSLGLHPLLPIWMNVASSTPWLLDFNTV